MDEQLMAKRRRNQRPRRTRGHITEDGGLKKRYEDNGERGIGDHRLDERAG